MFSRHQQIFRIGFLLVGDAMRLDNGNDLFQNTLIIVFVCFKPFCKFILLLGILRKGDDLAETLLDLYSFGTANDVAENQLDSRLLSIRAC